MNQIIIIGEVKKIRELKDKNAVLSVSTKDHEKKTIDINILIEQGYKNEMITILKTKPLVAIKCALRKSNKDNYSFVAEKMSILKLTQEEGE
jgi:hypothetical protein